LLADCTDTVQPPITGRISAFLPFLPFSQNEQAVGAHKYLLEFARELRRPVNLTPGDNEQLLGNVRLHVRRDASVCSHIAEEGYDQDLGIRSLIAAVRDHVEGPLLESYLAMEEEISEDQPLRDYVLDMRREELVVNISPQMKE
jgi:ATP-dependent Clp protease ATP-binding subunit ClpA